MSRYPHGAAVAVRGRRRKTKDHQGRDWFGEDAMAEERSITATRMVVSNLTKAIGDAEVTRFQLLVSAQPLSSMFSCRCPGSASWIIMDYHELELFPELFLLGNRRVSVAAYACLPHLHAAVQPRAAGEESGKALLPTHKFSSESNFRHEPSNSQSLIAEELQINRIWNPKGRQEDHTTTTPPPGNRNVPHDCFCLKFYPRCSEPDL
jgi:hypothetical protein